VSKPNDGYVFQRGNKWVARVTFTDSATGKRKEQWRTGKTEQHARELLAVMLASLPEQKANLGSLNSNNNPSSAPTFKTVAAKYAAHKIKPAQYRDDRKIAGLRSERTARIRLAVLLDYFGDTPIDRITNATVDRFRLERLATPTQYGRDRAIASVNRELELLRSILLYAVGEGYISKAPKAPITKAHETRRERILSFAEEKKLLKACDTPDRRHIIPLIIFAVETGMRKGEMLALTWRDVDIFANPRPVIRVRATTTKTLQSRVVPISKRLLEVLKAKASNDPTPPEYANDPPSSPVFAITTWQKSFAAACKDAGITGLRWHDLRATFITRLVESGAVSAETVAKISGHQDVATLYKHYLRNSASAIDAVGAVLDSIKR
jgi:integrase